MGVLTVNYCLLLFDRTHNLREHLCGHSGAPTSSHGVSLVGPVSFAQRLRCLAPLTWHILGNFPTRYFCFIK